LTELGSRAARVQALLEEDAKELKGYLAGASNTHDKRGRNGLFKERKATFNPVTLDYLADAWGVDVNSPTDLLNKQQSISPVNLSVIDSLEAAKAAYSAKTLFISNRTR
jgi:hypothetical protein